MGTIVEILAALVLWRLLLSVILSIAFALALSTAFSGFTAGYCITLVLLGTGFGIYWSGRAEAGIGLLAPVPHTAISKPVAFLGLLLIGFFWGGVASWLLGSQIFGAGALVLAVALTGAWFKFVLHRSISPSSLVFACVSLLCGFAFIPWLTAINA